MKLPGHSHGVVQVLHQNDAPQQIADDALEGPVGLHQVGRDAHKPGALIQAPLLERLALDGALRQECGAAAVAALQKSDGGLAVGFAVHDDILHSPAQRRLNGDGIGILGPEQGGNRTVDPAQPSAPGLLHHQAHGLGEALIVPLELLEHLRSGPVGLQFDAQGVQRLL